MSCGWQVRTPSPIIKQLSGGWAMTEDELQKEIRVLDLLPPWQRKVYLEEVQKARGVAVANRMRLALVEYWKSQR
jgi:hypothetical protein